MELRLVNFTKIVQVQKSAQFTLAFVARVFVFIVILSIQVKRVVTVVFVFLKFELANFIFQFSIPTLLLIILLTLVIEAQNVLRLDPTISSLLTRLSFLLFLLLCELLFLLRVQLLREWFFFETRIFIQEMLVLLIVSRVQFCRKLKSFFVFLTQIKFLVLSATSTLFQSLLGVYHAQNPKNFVCGSQTSRWNLYLGWLHHIWNGIWHMMHLQL